MSTTSPKAVSRSRKSDATATPTATAAKSQEPAGAPTKAPTLLDLMVANAEKAKSAADLARLCKVEDDTAFRRSLNHNSQGKRALSAHRAKLVKSDDPKTYVERRVTAPKSETKTEPTPDLAAALEQSIAEVKKTRAPRKPKTSRAQALVDEGLASSLTEAREQLADMS